jgi:hypothetical protein
MLKVRRMSRRFPPPLVDRRPMPLTLRPTGLKPPDAHERNPDWSVMSGELIVGRIYEMTATSNPDVRWFWAINGVHAGPDFMKTTGNAPTFEQAKADFKTNWEKWLAWAKLAAR